jgi:hypothetical protein
MTTEKVSVFTYYFPYTSSCSALTVDTFMIVVDDDGDDNEVINKGKAVPVRN